MAACTDGLHSDAVTLIVQGIVDGVHDMQCVPGRRPRWVVVVVYWPE
jgi:hypothetical protein